MWQAHIRRKPDLLARHGRAFAAARKEGCDSEGGGGMEEHGGTHLEREEGGGMPSGR